MSDLKCPMCQSTDIHTFRNNPDDHGMCWETYHKCKNCGRIARDYNWEKLTETEKLTVENQRLTAEIERLKAALDSCRYFANNSINCFNRYTQNDLMEMFYTIKATAEIALKDTPDTGKMEG